jgi:hypothetical protein
MTTLSDPHNRLTRQEANDKADEYASFAIATIGMLLDRGIIKFAQEPDIPKIVTSGWDPINDDITQAVLDRLEATLHKKEDKDE